MIPLPIKGTTRDIINSKIISSTGMMITFKMDNIKRNLGFLKIEIRSWKSSWIKLRNNKRPRIIKMYGEKSSPVEGNKIPSVVETRIEIASTDRTLVS